MKNIQGRDPNLKAKHGLPSGTAGGTARPHRCAPSCAPEFSGRLLSENGESCPVTCRDCISTPAIPNTLQ